MRTLLSIALLLQACICSGQDYQCVHQGVHRYFINSFGYLRAMRIDSGYTSPDSLVLHPFRTLRCPSPSTITPCTVLDRDGASWLGKKAIMLSDGKYICHTMWNDTVVINTRANIGDTWVFYNDASERRYIAEVIGKSAINILGSIDTIKKIQISAYDDSGIVYSDPVNGFQINISREHGFYRVFDLYTFPYHIPGNTYAPGFDYYLDRVCSLSAPARPTFENSVFTLTEPFVFPKTEGLYYSNILDEFEYKITDKDHPGTGKYPYQYLHMTITGNTFITGGKQYHYAGWLATQSYTGIYEPDSPYPYVKVPASGSYTVMDGQYLDSTYLPEEYGQKQILYYLPGDSSYCKKTRKYGTEACTLNDNLWEHITDSVSSCRMLKVLFGVVEEKWKRTGTNATNDTILIYSKKNGIACGNLHDPTGIPIAGDAARNQYCDIFPNPVSNMLHIATSFDGAYSISIVNAMGQTLLKSHMEKNPGTIDISSIPSGIYAVIIHGDNGLSYNQKLSVIH